MIADPSIPAPLVYVDPTFQLDLDVLSTIYDMSGASPVEIDTVELVQIDHGVYQGKYQFAAGKLYLVKTLVYTDGSFTTVDEDFGQIVLDVQCVASGGGGGDLSQIAAIVADLVKIVGLSRPSCGVEIEVDSTEVEVESQSDFELDLEVEVEQDISC